MDTMENQQLTKRFISFSKYSSLIVITIGLLAIVGWLLNIAAFISVLPGLQTMKINTAIAFLLAGIALWIANQESLSPRAFRIAQICNAGVFLIGSLTLAEYMFRLDLDIDQLIFKDLQAQESAFPGRMAFATALCFAMIGIASIAMVAGMSSILKAGQYLTVAVLSISLLALVGYVYDVQALYKLGPYSSMALHTAAGFALLALGTLSVQADRGWMGIISTETVGGVVLRRLLPFVLGIPIIIGWLIVSGDRAGLYETHFGLAMISVLTTGFLVITLWLNSRRLNRIDVDRKRAEEQIAYQASLLANVSDAIVASDSQYRLTAWNAAAEEMYGWQAAEVLGRTGVEILHTEFPDAGAEEMRRKIAETGKWQGEATQLHKDGRRIPVDVSSIVLRDVKGEVSGYLSVNRDITERKRVEEEIRTLNTELEQRVAERTTSLQDSLNFIRALYDVLQSVISFENLSEVLQSVVEAVARTVSADRATVFVLDHDARRVTNFVKAGPGMQDVAEEVTYDELMDGLSGWVIRELRPAFSPKGGPDSRESPSVQQRRAETNCGCIVVFPLLYLGDVLGTMTVINTPEQPDFTPQQVNWMEAIASQASAAIGRAQTTERLRKANLLLEKQSERLGQELIDRQHAEAALAVERDLLQALMDNIPDTIYFKDTASRFTRINRAQVRVLGVATPEDAIGKTDFDFFEANELAKGFYEEEQQIVKSGESLTNRMEFNPTSDGQPRWFSATKVPIKDKNGDVTGIVGVSRDITYQMQSEEALRQSEAKLRAIFDTMSEGIALNEIIYDEKGEMIDYRILEVNKAFYSTADYDGSQAIGNLATKLYGMSSEVIKAFWETHKTRSEIQHTEYFSPIKNRSFFISTSPFVNDRFVTSFLDITERKQVEEALRQSEERLRLAAWATKDAIWDWDLKTDQISWGTSLQKVFHYSPEFTQTDSEWRDMHIHPHDLDKMKHSLDRALEIGMEFWSKEYRLQRFDGTYADVMDRAYILRDDQGNPYRMIGAMMDITERRQAEATILHQNEMLSSLHQITLDLLSYREITPLLDALAELAAKFMDASYAEIMLVEEEILIVQAATQNQHHLIGERVGREDALLSWKAVDTREPAVLGDYQQWSHRRPVYDGFQLHAVADFPILNDEECLGVLALGREKPDHEFNLDQIQYGRLFANLTALVLHNAQLREALREQSIRDGLTGLFNRRYMEEALKQQLSRATRRRHPLGIIMLDIDHFKSINDTYGHAIGDALLRELGQLLKSHIRNEDIACRYGGEEFLLIMPDASLETACQRAELLRQSAKGLRVQEHAGQPLEGITLSLGVAIYPQHGRTTESVLNAADAALYRAKQEGRDRVVMAGTA